MDNTTYLLTRIGQLAVEHVTAWDNYKKIVEEEFEMRVAGKSVVTQLERVWRDVCATKVRLYSEVHGYLKYNDTNQRDN